MTDREKIFEIIDKAMGKIYFREDNINRITDALIAAGIGDVNKSKTVNLRTNGRISTK